MFQTIRTKTIVILFSVFFLFLSAYSIYQFKSIKAQAFATLESVNKTVNALLFEYTGAYIYNKDIENLQLSIDAIESEYIKSIYILDEEGHIIVQNKKTDMPHKAHPMFSALLKADEHSIKSEDEYLILNVYSILDVPVGYMVLEANLEAYHKRLSKQVDALLISGAILSIVFLIISFAISYSLSSPIEYIIKKLHRVQDNEVLQFKKQGQAEFEYLCNSISTSHNRLGHVNENLEVQVNHKTQELQDLNKTLEEKVVLAVKEVEDKNKMLQQQSRLAQMGEMISMIAHQWRQPLSAIAAVTMNMKLAFALQKYDFSKEDELKAFEKELSGNLDSIDGFVHNLTSTIDDFRNFFKSNKERVIIEVNDPVEKALKIIGVSIQNKGVKVETQLHSVKKLPMLDSEFMQVVLNILKNSQDNFSEQKTEEPHILISSYDTDTGVVLEFLDNGGGIPDDVLPFIFDPYFSTKNEKNGTGIGLYMSKTIVEDHHHGRLEAINQDKGVCFKISLKTKDESTRS